MCLHGFDVRARRASLVEPPGSSGTTDIELGELEERCVGEIDRVAFAAHALVDDGRSGGLAALLDGDGFSAVWVAVGLGAHQTDWESDDLVDAAIVGLSTGAEAGFVVGDVSFARGSG